RRRTCNRTRAWQGADARRAGAILLPLQARQCRSHHRIRLDHCGGCMADDGSRNFPNAQYYISQADYDYWTDAQKVGPDLKVFYETASKNLPPNKDRMVFIKDGQEFLPGIQAIATPGHTVGHTMFMIS